MCIQCIWPTLYQKNGKLEILYIDVNDLCGWAMIQALPYGGYEQLIMSLDEKLTKADHSENGYFADADLEQTGTI